MTEHRRLRIAFFVDAFPALSVTFIIDQIVGLLSRGHEVDVYAQRPGPGGEGHPDVVRWGLQGRTSYIGGPIGRGARLREMFRSLAVQPKRVGELLSALPPFSTGDEARTLRLFFARAAIRHPVQADVVHAHFGPNGNLASRLAEWGVVDAPIVTTFHGYDMRDGIASRGGIYASLRQRGSRFLSISGYNRGLLEGWGFATDRIVEHRVGIDVDSFEFSDARPTDGEIRVLTVANLVPEKGHIHLLRALREVRAQRPDLRWSLRFAGDGPERSALEAEVETLELGDVVTFIGGVPRDRVQEQLAWADLFVLPSIAEATPVALMEAQACGLPVVATRVGAVNEVVADVYSEYLTPAGDAGGLRDALLRLVDRRGDWPAMALSAREHVRTNYDLPMLVEQLEEIYWQVVAEA